MASQMQRKSFMSALVYYLLWTRIWLWDVPGAFARRWHQRTSLPIFDDVIRTVFRTFFNLANVQQLRCFLGEPNTNAAKVLGSTRFSPFKDNIYRKVIQETFTGYWMIQGDIESVQDPADSDIVIYYLQGGGYVAWTASNFIPFLLAISESLKALKPNLRVSMFVLEYDVAPEVQFPGQLRQAAAGYDWLVEDMGIDPKRIIVSGNSAGGHLSVSLLLHLRTPLPGVTSRIREKPNGAVLITPWLDIFPTKSYRSKHSPPRDVLDDPVGKYWASCFADPASLSDKDKMVYLRPLQCSLPWKAILPSKCAITTGTDDLLREGCLELRDQAKKCGLKIDVEIEEGQMHDWQWGEATNDLFYLNTSRSKKPEFDFKGAKQLARIISGMAEE